ncbi:MAG: DNA repair protein RecN [Candidatus Sulfomarinibacteraceae bacterium]
MLERLTVQGLGIIDAVEVELAPGFVALTGETGAGKSLLVTSLELLAGRRASAELVRTGDERLRVEGWFSVDRGSDLDEVLDEIGADGDGQLIVRRELNAAGRGRCWVNDVMVTVGALQKIAPHVLSIHGQNEQHGLADPDVQRRLVDDAGDHDELLEEVAARFDEWRSAADALAALESARANRRDRLDAIAYQLGEIDGVAPSEGEHEELTVRRKVLRNAARIRELGASILSRLDDDEDSVVDRIAQGEREIAELASHGLPLAEGAAGLAEARIHVEELVREVRGLTREIDGDPGELESVESRLYSLDQLMLKYGEPLEKVLEHRESLASEKARLEEVEDRLGTAAAEARSALGAYAEVAERLDLARRRAGADLARAVEAVLARLNMSGTTLEFQWHSRRDDSSPLVRGGEPVAFDARGVEECELLIAANPGEEPRPMARIASGGELSRIHLALRTVLREARPSGAMTLLFDEVDSGLGGATAAALANLLGDLAATDQVLAVTHLPQVAAAAKSHIRVDKIDEGGRSVTRVHVLDGEDRELELARMIAGDELGPSARAHARALLGES